MTVERPYIFTKSVLFEEGLNVYPESRLLSNWLNDRPLQRLAILRDANTNVDYLEYDRFKGSLWIGLIVRPSYPSTDLHGFFLGVNRGNRNLHGIYYVKGDIYPSYYSHDPNGPKMLTLGEGEPIDWQKMGSAKTRDVSKAHVIKHAQTDQRNAFYTRLIPSPKAPTAQISLSETFKNKSTLTFDSSFDLSIYEFEKIIAGAKKILEGSKFSAEKAGDFCEEMQIIFSPYFPM